MDDSKGSSELINKEKQSHSRVTPQVSRDNNGSLTAWRIFSVTEESNFQVESISKNKPESNYMKILQYSLDSRLIKIVGKVRLGKGNCGLFSIHECCYFMNLWRTVTPFCAWILIDKFSLPLGRFLPFPKVYARLPIVFF